MRLGLRLRVIFNHPQQSEKNLLMLHLNLHFTTFHSNVSLICKHFSFLDCRLKHLSDSHKSFVQLLSDSLVDAYLERYIYSLDPSHFFLKLILVVWYTLVCATYSSVLQQIFRSFKNICFKEHLRVTASASTKWCNWCRYVRLLADILSEKLLIWKIILIRKPVSIFLRNTQLRFRKTRWEIKIFQTVNWFW